MYAIWRKIIVERVFRRSTSTSTTTENLAPTPVQVYILLGQSNMLGMGRVSGETDGSLEFAVRSKGLYRYLVNDDGKWTTSNSVRNVRVMSSGNGSMHVYHNEFLTVRGETIGPEVGIGHCLEVAGADPAVPVMLLKSCIGNRSLGWDLLPPGSPRYDFNGRTYAGYKDSPASWPSDESKPDPIGWYAGLQYDADITNAKSVLAELDKYYPDASAYEVAGFFWWQVRTAMHYPWHWVGLLYIFSSIIFIELAILLHLILQGDKDRYDLSYATMYERNLVALIKQLRVEFNAPKAKFVLATLGQTALSNASRSEKLILDAMLAVDGNSGKYPEFSGNVTTVYSHPLSRGGSSNAHYNGNAETYMNIGEAMGRAMVDMNEYGKGGRCKEEGKQIVNESMMQQQHTFKFVPAAVV